jgi:hypothetical protein
MMTIFDFEKPINELESAIAELRQIAAEKGLDRSREIAELEAQRERLLRQIFAHLRPWDKVLLARHPKRPYALDYIRLMCESFIELHGDRLGVRRSRRRRGAGEDGRAQPRDCRAAEGARPQGATDGATSRWRSPKATAKRCACSVSPRSSACPC